MSEKKYTYKTHGTCSSKIDLTLDGDVIRRVEFTGGCNGNLTGISKLCVGMHAKDVIALLGGTRCGFKDTSCPDQLARALKKALEEQ